MALTDIETAFLTAVAGISGIEETYNVEPTRLDSLPAVTMLLTESPQSISSTGWSLVEYTWRVAITIKVDGLGDAQNELKLLIPSMLNVTRQSPSLSGTCEWADLNDKGEEPALYEGELWRKNLYLTATTLEAIGE